MIDPRATQEDGKEFDDDGEEGDAGEDYSIWFISGTDEEETDDSD